MAEKAKEKAAETTATEKDPKFAEKVYAAIRAIKGVVVPPEGTKRSDGTKFFLENPQKAYRWQTCLGMLSNDGRKFNMFSRYGIDPKAEFDLDTGIDGSMKKAKVKLLIDEKNLPNVVKFLTKAAGLVLDTPEAREFVGKRATKTKRAEERATKKAAKLKAATAEVEGAKAPATGAKPVASK